MHTFLSEFHLTEFMISELGATLVPPQVQGPYVLLARFRDNIYIILVNIVANMASVMRSVIMQLLRAMYRVPLKWEEACIPDTT